MGRHIFRKMWDWLEDGIGTSDYVMEARMFALVADCQLPRAVYYSDPAKFQFRNMPVISDLAGFVDPENSEENRILRDQMKEDAFKENIQSLKEQGKETIMQMKDIAGSETAPQKSAYQTMLDRAGDFFHTSGYAKEKKFFMRCYGFELTRPVYDRNIESLGFHKPYNKAVKTYKSETSGFLQNDPKSAWRAYDKVEWDVCHKVSEISAQIGMTSEHLKKYTRPFKKIDYHWALS